LGWAFASRQERQTPRPPGGQLFGRAFGSHAPDYGTGMDVCYSRFSKFSYASLRG
jgi:hypothetical protein